MPTPAPATPTPEAKPTEIPPIVEPKAGDVDDLGYTVPEIDTPNLIPAPEVKADEEKPKPSEELPAPKDATGYGEKTAEELAAEEAAKPKPVEKTAEELAKEAEAEKNKTPEEKSKEIAAKLVQENIKKSIDALPDNFNKDEVTKFAKENGLSDVQVEAYVKLETTNQANLVTEQAAAVQKQRDDWTTELKADPEFGGENFAKNVDRVNKVMDKYMQGTKKVLTERGTMLPPYIMRDFLKLDGILNPKSKLPIGEAPAVPKAEVSLLDAMYS